MTLRLSIMVLAALAAVMAGCAAPPEQQRDDLLSADRPRLAPAIKARAESSAAKPVQKLKTAKRVNTPAVPRPQKGPSTAALLRAGDELRIEVENEADLSGVYRVDSGGAVSFPLIGKVSAAGSKPDALGAQIAVRLKDGYLVAPRVRASFLQNCKCRP